MNKILIFFLISLALLNCKQIKQVQDHKDLCFQAVKSTGITDSLIWSDGNNKMFFHLNKSEFGEQTLEIYLDDNNLLSFYHDNGGTITQPFVVKSIGELFVCFFEVYDGTGSNSKKHIYHFNRKQSNLVSVEIEDIKTIISKVNSADSLYTRKGFLYNNQYFDKSCFTEKGTLPFSLILFNRNKPHMNNGLEGFGILKGVFEFKKQNNHFIFSAEKMKFQTRNIKR